jgi:hypothetical protein
VVSTLSEGDRAIAVSVLTEILAGWWVEQQTAEGATDA